MTLQELRKEPAFKILLRSGYANPELINHIELYYFYDSLIARGENVRDAAIWTADKFKYHEMSVHRIIKRIKLLNETCFNNSR